MSTPTVTRPAPGRLVKRLTAAARGARLSTWTVAVLLLVAVVANAILQPTFFTSYSLTSNFATFVPLVLIALAQTVVVLTGGIDLAIGATVTLASVVAVVLMDGRPERLALGVVAAVLVGVAAGTVNGLIVARLRLQPIIATFATASVFAGIALLVLPKPGGAVPGVLTRFYRDSVLGVPVGALLVALVVALWYLLVRTRLVRHVYAVGGDRDAAYASLVPVVRTQVGAYALCGGIGGLAAVALLANTGSGDPFIGLELTLNSVAAVVIGGTALMGGRGSGVGSVLGAIILSLVANVVFFAGISTNVRPLVSGLVIIGALALSALTVRERSTR